MYAFGVLVLVPPVVWRQTHNFHHANTAKIVGSHVGSFLMVTTEMWTKMSPRERLLYRAVRSPANVLLAVLTVFFLGMCVRPALRDPRKHWDSVLAVVVHTGGGAALIT